MSNPSAKGVLDLPTESIGYVVDVLRGNQKISWKKGLMALADVIKYLAGLSNDEDDVASIKRATKPKKVTRAKLADHLEALGKPGVKGLADFGWLVPILIDLLQKWASHQK